MLLPVWLFAQEGKEPNWLTFEQLSDSLNVKPKKTLIFFHTDWCGYCRKMENEVFTDKIIIKKLDEEYYIVKFDAESIDTVRFEGQVFTNSSEVKKRGQYHMLTRILAERNGEFSFPTTLLLDNSFSIIDHHFKYLSIKQLNKTLK